MVNKNLFLSAIVKKGYNLGTLAKSIGMSKNTMTSRVKGKTSFRLDEIDRICNVAGIDNDKEKCEIFLH